jgi:hypothetical protein
MNPILSVRFFSTEAGSEPVREWLKGLSAQDRKTIGEDIKTVQFGWPLGMPLVAHLEGDIWEVRHSWITESPAFCLYGQAYYDFAAWFYQEESKDTEARNRFGKTKIKSITR